MELSLSALGECKGPGYGLGMQTTMTLVISWLFVAPLAVRAQETLASSAQVAGPGGSQAPVETSVEIPARTAFAEPDARAMRRHKDGSVTRWTGTLNWFGRLETPGRLEIEIRLQPGAKPGKLRLAVSA